MNHPPYGCELDSLQRDGMPWEDEPETGACWNCGHMAPVTIGGRCYDLCVKERDNGTCGDVEVADGGTRNCEDWYDWDSRSA